MYTVVMNFTNDTAKVFSFIEAASSLEAVGVAMKELLGVPMESAVATVEIFSLNLVEELK